MMLLYNLFFYTEVDVSNPVSLNPWVIWDYSDELKTLGHYLDVETA